MRSPEPEAAARSHGGAEALDLNHASTLTGGYFPSGSVHKPPRPLRALHVRCMLGGRTPPGIFAADVVSVRG